MFKTPSPSSRSLRCGFFDILTAVAVLSSPLLMTARADIIYSGERNLMTSKAVSLLGTDERGVDLDGSGGTEFIMASTSLRTMLSPGRWVPSHLGIGNGMIWVPPSYLTTVINSLTCIPSVNLATTDKIGNPLSILSRDALIGPETRFSTTDRAAPADWPADRVAYFGFRFNPSGSRTLYGWGRMAVTTTRSAGVVTQSEMKLIDWAYDDTGAPILTAQMPPVIHHIRTDDGHMTITWSGGVLQKAETPSGPFKDVPSAVSPYSEPLAGQTRGFFRVRN